MVWLVDNLPFYSVLKLMAGFDIAALIAWKLTANRAIDNDITPAAIKMPGSLK